METEIYMPLIIKTELFDEPSLCKLKDEGHQNHFETDVDIKSEATEKITRKSTR